MIGLDRLKAAQKMLRRCLEVTPQNEKVWLDLAYVYALQGNDDQALTTYLKAISVEPKYSSAYNGVAVIYAKKGDRLSALATLKQALTANPNDAISAANLARLLENGNQLQEALEYYQRVLSLSSTVKNYQSVISICQKLDLLKLAVLTCRTGLKQHPRSITLRRLLVRLEEGPVHIPVEIDQHVREQIKNALQLLKTGDIKSTDRMFEDLYLNYPYHPILLHNYGAYCLQYTEGKNITEALDMLDRAILTFPNFIPPYKVLAQHFFSQNDFESVILIVKEAIQFSKKTSDLYYILGIALRNTGQLKEAIQIMEEGTQVAKNPPIGMYSDLGMLYSIDGQFTKAKNSYQKVLEIDPSHDNAKFNYGLLLARSGKVDESIEIFNSLPSPDRNTYEALLYSVACHPEKHRQLPKYLHNWAEKYANHIEAPVIKSPRNKRTKIRIGYVSPDFRNHPVAYFMVGPYKHHNKNEFEIYSYNNGTDIDDYTLYLKDLSEVWRDVRPLSDQELVEQISKDQIDILIDLSGHTSNNRLPVFVGKPAPIQVSYLGYLTTTGIPQMDYRLIDSYAKPDICTEELIELPNCYLCYQPFRLDVSTSSHAKSKNGGTTFGSFHRLPKIHGRLIRIWSEILTKVPDSVLLMKTRYLDSLDIKNDFLDQFIACGVPPERVVFKDHADSFVDHLAGYDDIDIMLDTFPYNGTTITCESLWMGVPVVTWAGDLHLSRVGVSINTNAGLSDLVGQDESEYIRIAVELAKDERRLLNYNRTLRDQFLSSKVCDPIMFTKNLEIEYKKMYHKWYMK